MRQDYLSASNNVVLSGQNINQFALSLVAPLGSQHHAHLRNGLLPCDSLRRSLWGSHCMSVEPRATSPYRMKPFSAKLSPP